LLDGELPNGEVVKYYVMGQTPKLILRVINHLASILTILKMHELFKYIMKLVGRLLRAILKNTLN
jgi:hypothetical protein